MMAKNVTIVLSLRATEGQLLGEPKCRPATIAPVSAAISKTRAGSVVARLARGFPRKVVLGLIRNHYELVGIITN